MRSLLPRLRVVPGINNNLINRLWCYLMLLFKKTILNLYPVLPFTLIQHISVTYFSDAGSIHFSARSRLASVYVMSLTLLNDRGIALEDLSVAGNSGTANCSPISLHAPGGGENDEAWLGGGNDDWLGEDSSVMSVLCPLSAGHEQLLHLAVPPVLVETSAIFDNDPVPCTT